MTTDTKYRILYTSLRTICRLPLRLLYPLSDLASFILYRVVKYRVDIVRGNLRAAFPQWTQTQVRKVEKQFYRHLCDIFIETAKLAHISDREINRRVQITGYETVAQALSQNRPVVLMLGHYGNWEWVTSIAREIPDTVIAGEIYHPLRNKVFDRLMLRLRSRFGTENIPMKHTYRRLVEIRRQGSNFVCGFIADQRPFTPVLKHWTDFLGIDTAYVDGGEVIGKKLNAEFVYVEMLPIRRGHYRMSLTKLTPIDDGAENPVTRAYLRQLEASIRRNPSYWLWSHNRWKRKRQ